MQRTFDKNATNLCKGVAICIMLYYHAFGATDLSLFRPVIPVLYNILGPYGNVCVPIFVLLTGYGIGIKNLERNTAYAIQVEQRLLSIYRSYWPAFLLGFVCAPFLACEYGSWEFAFGTDSLLSIVERFCLNFLGLSHYVFGDGIYTLNQTWWYISLALILIPLLPVMTDLWNRIKWWAMLPFLLAAVLMPSLRYLAYFPVAMLGVCLAGCNGFDTIHSRGRSPAGYLLRSILFVAVLILWYRMRQHDLYPVLANSLAAWAICQFSYDVLSSIPILRTVLIFLGKHSANLFYLHSFVYTYWSISKDAVFRFRYDLLIWLVILIFSLLLSLLLEQIKKLSRWNALFEKLQRKVQPPTA